jgi:hypothetical protein
LSSSSNQSTSLLLIKLPSSHDIPSISIPQQTLF